MAPHLGPTGSEQLRLRIWRLHCRAEWPVNPAVSSKHRTDFSFLKNNNGACLWRNVHEGSVKGGLQEGSGAATATERKFPLSAWSCEKIQRVRCEGAPPPMTRTQSLRLLSV